MPVVLQSIPTRNTTNLDLRLYRNGDQVLILPANQTQVLTLSFDEIRIISIPPAFLPQNPPAVVNIQPGNLAYFAGTEAGMSLSYAPQNGLPQHVHFSAANAEE